MMVAPGRVGGCPASEYWPLLQLPASAGPTPPGTLARIADASAKRSSRLFPAPRHLVAADAFHARLSRIWARERERAHDSCFAASVLTAPWSPPKQFTS